MILQILFYYLVLLLFLQYFRLNRDRKIIFIILFNLNYNTYSHCLSCKAHLNNFMQKRTWELNTLKSWWLSGDWTYFNQSKFLNWLITNKNIILISANAWWNPFSGNLHTIIIQSLIKTKLMLLNLNYFSLFHI